MAGKVLNVVLFNFGWFACVLGAAVGRFWVGPLAVAGILTFDIWLCRHRRAELVLIAPGMAIGFACDSLLVWLSEALEGRSATATGSPGRYATPDAE